MSGTFAQHHLPDIILSGSSDSRHDLSKEAPGKNEHNIFLPLIDHHPQCIVGDSSTVKHGSPYLKKWLAWLDANADVRFAEFDSI